MSEQSRYALALSEITGLGLYGIRQLLNRYATPKAIFSSPTAELLRTPKVRPELLRQIIEKSTLASADRILLRCQRLGIRLIFLEDNDYPRLLGHIHLPPVLIYVAGSPKVLQKPCVALVGTRRMTSYGERQIAKICEVLSAHDVSIVCGLGEGIERRATQEALRRGLSPIVVYPTGLQYPYPSTVPMALIEQAREAGCLLSEYPPDVKLQRHAFLARHRIIAGLSQQIVLVESARAGGAMQLAQHAQAENREVYAIPGDVHKTRSEGANLLIRDNVAQLLSSAEDLLQGLNLQHIKPKASSLQSIKTRLSQEEKKIVEVLGTSEKALHIDFILKHTDLSIDQLSVLLFNLECQHMIEVLPGSHYRRRLR